MSGFTSHAKDQILAGKVLNGNLPFNSITIRREEGGGLRLELIHNGKSVAWMLASEPNFSAGDTLNISGFDAQMKIQLSQE